MTARQQIARLLPLVLLVILVAAGLRGEVLAPRWNGPLKSDGVPIGLALEVVRREVVIHLFPVPDPDVDRTPPRRLPRRREESPRVRHLAPPQPLAAAITASPTSVPSCSACRAAASTRL